MAQALVKALAKRGRGNDRFMVHAAPNETMIPSRVLDENPQLIGAIAKAMGKSGLDWRQYMVGSPKASVNPMTGAQEFQDLEGDAPDMSFGEYGSADAAQAVDTSMDSDPGMMGGSGFLGEGPGQPTAQDYGFAPPGPEQGPSQGYDVTFGPRDLVTGGASFLGGLLLGAPGAMAARGAATAATRGMSGNDFTVFSVGGAPISDRSYGPSDAMTAQEAEFMGYEGAGTQFPIGTAPPPATTSQVPVAEPPGFMSFDPAMTDLQRRAMIATYGSQGEDSAFRDPATTQYYISLLRNALQGGNYALPVEERYLRDTLGYSFEPNSQALLNAIASA
jgi:hypothetical protein